MSNNSSNIRMLAELGIAIALALLLDFLKVYQMPYGGSVSLEMLPIFIVAFRWGLKGGLLAGTGFGLLQLVTGPYVVHWVQFFLDYPIAFGGLGLAGIFAGYVQKQQNVVAPIVAGVLLGGVARFVAHMIAGVVFFGHFAPEGQSPVVYSLLYNMSYMVPETIITIVVIVILAMHRRSNEFFRNPKLSSS